MQEIDLRASTDYGIPSLVLMENAGLQVVHAAQQVLGDLAGKVILVLAGKGNNGGDALVAARHFLQKGASVKVMLDGEPADIKGEALVNFNIWDKLGQRVHLLTERNAIQVLQVALLQTDLVIDGLYGTGFRGAIKDRTRKVVEAVNDSGKTIIAIDIPSGVEADSGAVWGVAVKASYTVTFGLSKIGLHLDSGAEYVGRLQVADISLPRTLLDSSPLGTDYFLTTDNMAGKWLPPRSRSAHKGAFGHVLVVGGSRGMLGAACLAGEAALRSGAGLVTLAVPRSLQEVAAGYRPEIMTLGLPETGAGTINRDGRELIEAFLKKVDAVVLGPGLSTHPETTTMVRELVASIRVPTVLDADALNALAEEASENGAVSPEDLFKENKLPLVFTPHPGEMARLLKVKTADVQQKRLFTVEKAARSWNSTVVLKGARTLVAAPGARQVYINDTGNPGMATGGTGDVLSGLTGGLLAQGLEAVNAAALAVYVHGKAGDQAASAKGETALIAGDLLAWLPTVFSSLELRPC